MVGLPTGIRLFTLICKKICRPKMIFWSPVPVLHSSFDDLVLTFWTTTMCFVKRKWKWIEASENWEVGQGSIEGCKWQGGFGLPQISISKYEDYFIISFLWDVILRTQERSWKFHSHYPNNPLIEPMLYILVSVTSRCLPNWNCQWFSFQTCSMPNILI